MKEESVLFWKTMCKICCCLNIEGLLLLFIFAGTFLQERTTIWGTHSGMLICWLGLSNCSSGSWKTHCFHVPDLTPFWVDFVSTMTGKFNLYSVNNGAFYCAISNELSYMWKRTRFYLNLMISILDLTNNKLIPVFYCRTKLDYEFGCIVIKSWIYFLYVVCSLVYILNSYAQLDEH